MHSSPLRKLKKSTNESVKVVKNKSDLYLQDTWSRTVKSAYKHTGHRSVKQMRWSPPALLLLISIQQCVTILSQGLKDRPTAFRSTDTIASYASTLCDNSNELLVGCPGNSGTDLDTISMCMACIERLCPVLGGKKHRAEVRDHCRTTRGRNIHAHFPRKCRNQVDNTTVTLVTRLIAAAKLRTNQKLDHNRRGGSTVRQLLLTQTCAYAAIDQFRAALSKYVAPGLRWAGKGGTVIGQHCGSSIRPWDDDVDVMVESIADLKKLYSATRAATPQELSQATLLVERMNPDWGTARVIDTPDVNDANRFEKLLFYRLKNDTQRMKIKTLNYHDVVTNGEIGGVDVFGGQLYSKGTMQDMPFGPTMLPVIGGLDAIAAYTKTKTHCEASDNMDLVMGSGVKWCC